MTLENRFVLSIDQGTTSSRAIVFDGYGKIMSSAQKKIKQIYPADGWVEHDPEEIWETTVLVCKEAIATCGNEISRIGISNQRETIVLWDRKTGIPLSNAIVWQDRRTFETCTRLREQNLENFVLERTGLVLDPYFSATKLCWLLDHVSDARKRAENGELAAGTIDSFLVWRLTEGKVHATDATNASRTLLFNIHKQRWDFDLMEIFNVPELVLPEVKDSADDYGRSSAKILGSSVPILGVAGDQQAALIGQACVQPGMVKSTYGTGGFVLLNTGAQAIESKHGLLTTLCYRIEGKAHYALEGSIFNAGTSIEWLRDSLGLISSATESEALARTSSSDNRVMFVPGFTGLGAPHWSPNARGSIYGLTRDTVPADLVRAGLESVGYQSAELLDSMAADSGQTITTLRVDGGMVKNDWMLQFLSDITGINVERPGMIEASALGAAFLANLRAGILTSFDGLDRFLEIDKKFQPQMSSTKRQALLSTWGRAIKATQSFSSS